MNILTEMFKAAEGDKPLCVLCRRRVKDNEIVSDGIAVCKECYKKVMEKKVDDYYETENSLKRLFAPFTYQGKIRQAILDLKFNSCPLFAGALGKLLFRALPPFYLYDFDAIVPIPLHTKRLNKRGFNQAELLAESFSEEIKIPVLSDALFRIRDTKRQMILTRSLRDMNMRGAFYAVEEVVKGKKILVLDDIYTAGSTAGEAAKELLSKGASEVSCIVLCSNFYKNSSREIRVNIPTVFKHKK